MLPLDNNQCEYFGERYYAMGQALSIDAGIINVNFSDTTDSESWDRLKNIAYYRYNVPNTYIHMSRTRMYFDILDTDKPIQHISLDNEFVIESNTPSFNSKVFSLVDKDSIDTVLTTLLGSLV